MSINRKQAEILEDAMRMYKFIQKRIKMLEPDIYYLFKNQNYKNLIK